MRQIKKEVVSTLIQISKITINPDKSVTVTDLPDYVIIGEVNEKSALRSLARVFPDERIVIRTMTVQKETYTMDSETFLKYATKANIEEDLQKIESEVK